MALLKGNNDTFYFEPFINDTGRLKYIAVISIKLPQRYFTDEQKIFMTENPTPDYLDKFNLKVKLYRLKNHLKQKQVSDFIGVSITTYMDYENEGTVTLLPSHYDKLAELFGISVDKLLDGYNRFLYLGQKEQLKEYRRQHGITQKELAKRLSLTIPYVKRWESGRTKLPKEFWEKIFKLDNM